MPRATDKFTDSMALVVCAAYFGYMICSAPDTFDRLCLRTCTEPIVSFLRDRDQLSPSLYLPLSSEHGKHRMPCSSVAERGLGEAEQEQLGTREKEAASPC